MLRDVESLTNFSFSINEFVRNVENVQLYFADRYLNYKKFSNTMLLFSIPFIVLFTEFDAEFQLKLLNLKDNYSLKNIHKNEPLIKFYSLILARKFPKSKNVGSTNLCMHTFLKMQNQTFT